MMEPKVGDIVLLGNSPESPAFNNLKIAEVSGGFRLVTVDGNRVSGTYTTISNLMYAHRGWRYIAIVRDGITTVIPKPVFKGCTIRD